MKVTLQVYDNEEMTFSEEELITIVEKYLQITTEVASEPTEGKWFEVKPKTIDKKLFKDKRNDKSQEDTRKLILRAFDEMDKYPEKYFRNFKTMIPKILPNGTPKGFKYVAERRGDEMADWVHQALEWAQRITNGETWESVCNVFDAANYHRLVKSFFSGRYLLVGGSVKSDHYFPASQTHYAHYHERESFLEDAVPLIVLYE